MYKIYYTLFDEIESALSGVPLHQKFIFMRGPKIIMSVMILNLNANDKVVNTFVDAFNSFLLEKRIETTIIEANGVSLLEYEPLYDSPIFEILVVVGHGNSCDKRNTSNLSMGFDDVEPFPGALNNLTILGQLLPNINNPFLFCLPVVTFCPPKRLGLLITTITVLALLPHKSGCQWIKPEWYPIWLNICCWSAKKALTQLFSRQL